jgi:plastocyanin
MLTRMRAHRANAARSLLLVGGVLVLVAVGFLSGCGSNTTSSTTPAAATTTTLVGYAGASPLNDLPMITVAGGKLSSTSLDVSQGSGVVFKNGEDDVSVKYHLVADDGSFDTGVLTPGAEFVVFFSNAGTIAYHDELNPAIKGAIVVSTAITAGVPQVLPMAGLQVLLTQGKLAVTDIQAALGDSVTFVNNDDDSTRQYHLVADDGSFDTGVLSSGQSYTVDLLKTGNYPFHDVLDASIKGTITVKQ